MLKMLLRRCFVLLVERRSLSVLQLLVVVLGVVVDFVDVPDDGQLEFGIAGFAKFSTIS